MIQHPVFVGEVDPALIASSLEQQTVLLPLAVHQQRDAEIAAYRARVA